ncbi:MAG: hypothetical protein ABJC24_03860 [Chloroflexota bacterium]
MVIAALIAFAALLVAWLAAPSGRRRSPSLAEPVPTLVPEAA